MRFKLKEHGNAVAVGLGLLALVVAGSGTAVAAAATVVNIADPTTPANKAKVDASGRVLVAQQAFNSTIASAGSFLNSGTVPVTSPTTASLVITGFSVSETRLNGTTNGADLGVYLAQTTVSGGACTSTAIRYILVTSLSSGDSQELAGSSRLQIKPVGGAPYCLAIYSYIVNGGTDATTYYPQYTFTGYVASGSYTGMGTGAAAPSAAPSGLVKKQPAS